MAFLKKAEEINYQETRLQFKNGFGSAIQMGDRFLKQLQSWYQTSLWDYVNDFYSAFKLLHVSRNSHLSSQRRDADFKFSKGELPTAEWTEA